MHLVQAVLAACAGRTVSPGQGAQPTAAADESVPGRGQVVLEAAARKSNVHARGPGAPVGSAGHLGARDLDPAARTGDLTWQPNSRQNRQRMGSPGQEVRADFIELRLLGRVPPQHAAGALTAEIEYR